MAIHFHRSVEIVEKRPCWHRVFFLSLFGRERNNMFIYAYIVLSRCVRIM
jgi:hypothetical protein